MNGARERRPVQRGAVEIRRHRLGAGEITPRGNCRGTTLRQRGGIDLRRVTQAPCRAPRHRGKRCGLIRAPSNRLFSRWRAAETRRLHDMGRRKLA